jgi:nitrogen regulatory protein PII
MKRIEVVMDNRALDTFRHAAGALGIWEYELMEVRRSSIHHFESKRIFRGQSYSVELSLRTKVEFTVADQEVEQVTGFLASGIGPDSISILPINQLVVLDGDAATTPQNRPAMDNRMALA